MGQQTLTGRCLCGQVTYTVVGEARRFYHCHCSRCRRVTGTGHASNVFVEGTLTWDSGQALIASYTPPDAARFVNAFCRECGSRVPRASGAHTLIPAGSLDVVPDLAPQARIHMASRAPWSCRDSILPELDAGPELSR